MRKLKQSIANALHRYPGAEEKLRVEQGSLLWAVPQTWDVLGAAVKNLLHAILSASHLRM